MCDRWKWRRQATNASRWVSLPALPKCRQRWLRTWEKRNWVITHKQRCQCRHRQPRVVDLIWAMVAGDVDTDAAVGGQEPCSCRCPSSCPCPIRYRPTVLGVTAISANAWYRLAPTSASGHHELALSAGRTAETIAGALWLTGRSDAAPPPAVSPHSLSPTPHM